MVLTFSLMTRSTNNQRGRELRPRAWRWILLPVVLVSLLATTALGEGLLRPGDAIWEVSTRHLPECIPSDSDFSFRVSRLADCQWHQSSEAELITEAIEEPKRTLIYAHGNWFNVCDARQRVVRVYRLARQLTDEPFRIILISWPSEQRYRFAKDVISKKAILDSSSFYLANFIERYPADQPIGLLGYSFGGRIVCGALHLIHGGAIAGQELSFTPRLLETYRLGLIAPAFDRSALSETGKFSEAMAAVETLVNLYNSRDPILRRFRFFDRRNEPVAAGFAGISDPRITSPLVADPRIKQYDCRSIGRTHDELEYFCCTPIYVCLKNVLGM
jgi:hypothetical protein